MAALSKPVFRSPGRPARPMDPLERYVPLGIKGLVYLILIVYLVQAADAFYEVAPGRSWPFLLAAIRNGIFLFIHEGGHFLFMFFGETLRILGGSFWQIVFPLLSCIIAVRKRSHFIAPFALFWVGTNMMDVSLYMRDAPLRLLPLLGGHKSWHDWWNLFRKWDMLDSAGTVADIFYFLGLFVSIVAIGGGIYLAVQRYLNPIPYKISEDEEESRVAPSLLRSALPTHQLQRKESVSPPAAEGEEKNTFDGL
jgi:hypothetical protein